MKIFFAWVPRLRLSLSGACRLAPLLVWTIPQLRSTSHTSNDNNLDQSNEKLHLFEQRNESLRNLHGFSSKVDGMGQTTSVVDLDL